MRLLVYHVVWNASMGIAASLYVVSMLDVLQIGFAGMAVYNAGLAAIRIVATPAWGKVIDRLGARPV